MESSRRLSVGEIAEQLLRDGLIDVCELRKEHVVLLQDGKRHTFSYRDAHTFMLGIVRGRSWTPLLAADPRRLHAVLDDLADTARSLDLIRRFENIGDGQVRITLSACQAELPDEEAVAFLADCILHRFKSMEDDARPADHDASWSADVRTEPALSDN